MNHGRVVAAVGVSCAAITAMLFEVHCALAVCWMVVVAFGSGLWVGVVVALSRDGASRDKTVMQNTSVQTDQLPARRVTGNDTASLGTHKNKTFAYMVRSHADYIEWASTQANPSPGMQRLLQYAEEHSHIGKGDRS